MKQAGENWKRISAEDYLDAFQAKPHIVEAMRSTIEMIAPECDFYLTEEGEPEIIYVGVKDANSS